MSDDKVTRLFPDRVVPTELTPGPDAPPAPNPELVKCLEAFLEDAKAGHLQRLYAVGLGTGRCQCTWQAVFGVGAQINYYESLGAIADMQSNFQNRHFADLDGIDFEEDDR